MLGTSILRPHLWRARLVACLSALWVVFGAAVAHAVTLVPMCSEHAETVVAPPIFRAASNSALRSGACEDPGRFGIESGLPERTPERVAAPEGAPRMPPIYFYLPPIPHSRAPLEGTTVHERPGYRSGIERPPR